MFNVYCQHLTLQLPSKDIYKNKAGCKIKKSNQKREIMLIDFKSLFKTFKEENCLYGLFLPI